jgi:tetratricopeptide (TPR) repeat protein
LYGGLKIKNPSKLLSALTKQSSKAHGAMRSSSAQILNAAIEHHRRGDWVQAEEMYKALLLEDPKHFDALQLLGTVYAQTAKYQLGIDYLTKACSLINGNVNIHNNLGFCFKEIGDYERAINSFKKAIEIEPSYAQAYNNLGNVYKDIQNNQLAQLNYLHSIVFMPENTEAYYNLSQLLFDAGRPEDALVGYEKALLISPNNIQAITNRAFVYLKTNRYEDCITECNRALAFHAQNPQALNHKATALLELGNILQAQECLEFATQTSPNFPDTHINLANLYKSQGFLIAAVQGYTRALNLNPFSKEARINRALAYKDNHEYWLASKDYEFLICNDPSQSAAYLGRANMMRDLYLREDALRDFDRCLAITPNNPVAHNNRGNLLSNTTQSKQALKDYFNALILSPGYAEAYNNIGIYWHEQLKLELAVLNFNRASTIDPGLIDTQWNKALVSLLRGDLANGFELFEKRWDHKILGLTQSPKTLTKPLWRAGQSIKNKSILLYWEQGLGDSLQFLRYIPRLNELGAKIHLYIQEPLLCLFDKLQDGYQMQSVFSDSDLFSSTIDQVDFICPLMSLALCFGTDLVRAPPPPPLRIHPALIKKEPWTNLLGSVKTGAQHKVIGFACSGRKEHLNDTNRSIPFETLFAHLPKTHRYVCLQKELRSSDIQAVERETMHGGLIELSAHIKNFADTASVINQLDLVVCVDTSVAHLAASMNKPTWLLLPYSCDWRWLLNIDRSPWYPSIKIFRQHLPYDWSDALTHLSHELEQLQ